MSNFCNISDIKVTCSHHKHVFKCAWAVKQTSQKVSRELITRQRYIIHPDHCWFVLYFCLKTLILQFKFINHVKLSRWAFLAWVQLSNLRFDNRNFHWLAVINLSTKISDFKSKLACLSYLRTYHIWTGFWKSRILIGR